MASIELNSRDRFNQLKQRLSLDLEKELTESEFVSLLLQLGVDRYENLLKMTKYKLKDSGFTMEKY